MLNLAGMIAEVMVEKVPEQRSKFESGPRADVVFRLRAGVQDRVVDIRVSGRVRAVRCGILHGALLPGDLH